MRNAIPAIITLLKDSQDYIQKAAADALFKLSEYCKGVNFLDIIPLISILAEFQLPIKTGFLDIIRLLSDRDDNIRIAGSDTLSKLSDRGKTVTLLGLALLTSILAVFRPLIKPAIRDIVNFLKPTHSRVRRRAGADAVSKLSEHGKSVDL